MASFESCYKFVRAREGGNVDHPKDPGGRTSRGVTQRVYDGYRRSRKLKPRDVYTADEAEVEAIYREQYWVPAKAEKLPAGVDLVVFDIAINSGTSRAYKILQKALGLMGANVRVDGTPGFVTISAASKVSAKELIETMAALRLAFYKGLTTWRTFGKGWSARNEHVTKAALKLAKGGKAPVAAKAKPAQEPVLEDGKALDEDIAKPPVSASGGTGVTTVGVGGAGTVDAVQEQVRNAGDQLTPYADTMDYLKYALLLIAVVGLALTFYAVWRNWKNNRLLNGGI